MPGIKAIELKDVKRKTLPALDDALAREVGDFDSLDALRAAVRTDLGEHLKRESESAVRQQLVDQILEANQFDVPPSWTLSEPAPNWTAPFIIASPDSASALFPAPNLAAPVTVPSATSRVSLPDPKRI